MEGVRLAGMFYEQRGPLVFSASVHLVVLVTAAIWVMVSPEKDPEDFNFELVPPPAGDYAELPADQPLEAIKYTSEQMDLPSLDDIVLPKRAPVVVEVDMSEPDPVVEEKPLVPVEQTPPKAAPMSLEEFEKLHGKAQITAVRKTPPKTQTQKIDVTKNLGQTTIGNLPTTSLENYSLADQSAVNAYIANFRAALKRTVKNHPKVGDGLSVRVQCDISSSGKITNVFVLESSGDPVYDSKVVDAYYRLGTIAPPPERKAIPELGIWFNQ